MRLKDVPKHPAYLVFHDGFDGSMEIWPCATIKWAEQIAKLRQEELDNSGMEGAGMWRAYTKLPRKSVYKFHDKNPGEPVMSRIDRFMIFGGTERYLLIGRP